MNVSTYHSGQSDLAARRGAFAIGVALLMLLNFCLVVFVCAQDNKPAAIADDNIVMTQVDGPADVAADAVRFEALDVFVDSGQQALAAYQFELFSTTDGVEIVGIEGGEHAAFQAAPYYDPQAMQTNRVILAAFSTDKELPTGRTRVARIHVQLQGPGRKEYQTVLKVSATVDGTEIPAKISLQQASRK
ncbi:MAG: hypothetical protein R3C59_01755 [Planctomycetaceae bacterium]